MLSPSDIHELKRLREFYAGIAEDQWCAGQFRDAEGRKCAVGHVAFKDGHLDRSAIESVSKLLVRAGSGRGDLQFANDHAVVSSITKRERLGSPKQRVVRFMDLLLQRAGVAPEKAACDGAE